MKYNRKFGALMFGLVAGFVMTSCNSETGPDAMSYPEGYYDIYLYTQSGIQSSDFKEMKKSKAIFCAEGGFVQDAVVSGNNVQEEVEVRSLTRTLAVPTVLEGRLPKAETECVITAEIADALGLKVGDRFSISKDAQAEPSEVTVVGLVEYHSEHMSEECVVMTEDSFEKSGYDCIYIALSDTAFTDRTSSEYSDRMNSAVSELEKMNETFAKNRYDSLVSEYGDRLEELESLNHLLFDERLKKLEDASSELSEKYLDLESAKNEIEEKKADLESAKKELYKAEDKLKSAKKELESAEDELEGYRETLDENWDEFRSTLKENDLKEDKLEAAVKEIDAGIKEIEDLEKQADASLKEIESGKKQLESGISTAKSQTSQLKSAQSTLKSSASKLDSQDAAILNDFSTADKNLSASIADKKSKLQTAAITSETCKVQITELNKQLDAKKERLKEITSKPIPSVEETIELVTLQAEIPLMEQQISQLTAQKEAADKEVSQLTDDLTNLATVQAVVQSLQETLKQQGQPVPAQPVSVVLASMISEAESTTSSLQAQLEELNANEKQIKEKKSEAKAQKEELKKTKSAVKELISARDELNKAETSYASASKELRKKQTEYESGEKEYKEGKSEYESGKQKLSEGESEFKDSSSKYDDAQSEYDEARLSYETDREEAEDKKNRLVMEQNAIEMFKWTMYCVKDNIEFSSTSASASGNIDENSSSPWEEAIDTLINSSNYTVLQTLKTDETKVNEFYFTKNTSCLTTDEETVYYDRSADKTIVCGFVDDPGVWVEKEIEDADYYFYAFTLINRLRSIEAYINQGQLKYDEESQSYKGSDLNGSYVYDGKVHAPIYLEISLEDGHFVSLKESWTDEGRKVEEEILIKDYGITSVRLPENRVTEEQADEYKDMNGENESDESGESASEEETSTEKKE